VLTYNCKTQSKREGCKSREPKLIGLTYYQRATVGLNGASNPTRKPVAASAAISQPAAIILLWCRCKSAVLLLQSISGIAVAVSAPTQQSAIRAAMRVVSLSLQTPLPATLTCTTILGTSATTKRFTANCVCQPLLLSLQVDDGQVDRVVASSKSVQRQQLHKRQWQGGSPAGALQLLRYTNINRTWAQQQQQRTHSGAANSTASCKLAQQVLAAQNRPRCCFGAVYSSPAAVQRSQNNQATRVSQSHRCSSLCRRLYPRKQQTYCAVLI